MEGSPGEGVLDGAGGKQHITESAPKELASREMFSGPCATQPHALYSSWEIYLMSFFTAVVSKMKGLRTGCKDMGQHQH